MATPSTKDRILDAAEILFATHGYHCTSLRALTQKADANLAAVNYHFGSKEALVEALLERRLQPLNLLRQQCLDEVLLAAKTDGKTPDAGDILRAFIEPTLTFAESGKGPRHFVAFIGRILVEPEDGLRSLFMKQIRPLFANFYGALRQALPQVSEQLVFMRLLLTIGMVSNAMCGLDRFMGKSKEFPLPDKVPPVQDTQQLCDMILAFVLPGLEKA